MLLVFMYHRAKPERHGNPADMLDAHFRVVAERCRNVLPGELLAPGKVNVCLSFDDAYYDFYAVVFPLLRRYQLRALLAVPPGVIRDRVDATAGERLRVESAAGFAAPEQGAFCTWPELAEMTESGLVTIAAHGQTHCRLDGPEADLAGEIAAPRRELESRLGRRVASFVFPFGRFSPQALQYSGKHYAYRFRIGGAMNRGWHGGPLYRVDADRMASPGALLAPARLLRYRVRYAWNRLRHR